ncbi:hypothetical protein TW1_021 [Pseudoalteromonas phage TW1]|uniref:hypothetical protein n=1 Tax=Pseudoalteromonas phage TW1 TaxID=1366055 RepID=UPI00035AAD24|nr:hypothetical protein PP585_gp21 [Pseudoalteromonas phage TW1]AGR46537.1 hypothetical protein TW1_021 [Pseudoalteromonas phage TW1]
MIYLSWYMAIGVFAYLVMQLISMIIYRMKNKVKPVLVSPKDFLISVKSVLSDEFKDNGADIYALSGVVCFLLFWPVIIPIVFYKGDLH